MSDTVANDPAGIPLVNRRLSRWLKIGLVGSLALNLLVLGVVGASVWHWRHGGPPGGSIVFAGHKFLRELPRERRQVLDRIIRSHRLARWQLWRDLRRARNEFAAAMRSEPLEQPRLQRALNEMQRLELTVREEFLPVFGELASALTLAEREKFVGELRRHRPPPGP